jgi:hypothetical protein
MRHDLWSSSCGEGPDPADLGLAPASVTGDTPDGDRVHTVGGPPAEPDLNGADAVRGAMTSSPGSRFPGNAPAAWAATREGSSPPL